ncbi:hypothetical protein [Nonomuraea ferruginea]|uniref:Uncharacterized protein n=1 Tax=Nonomuraea ferruginea TaxID=46174 RepID=A0ABT4T270_9ACTN|nr:hypothetical protein [Nonomuraea ferruginea]MDA0643582.1 hypothetical protein [Nonomuraea ferruginea]
MIGAQQTTEHELGISSHPVTPVGAPAGSLPRLLGSTLPAAIQLQLKAAQSRLHRRILYLENSHEPLAPGCDHWLGDGRDKPRPRRPDDQPFQAHASRM